MNKPYTCHHCGTAFDVLPERVVAAFEDRPQPQRMKVKCPGCFSHGFTVEQSIYILDLTTMTPVE